MTDHLVLAKQHIVAQLIFRVKEMKALENFMIDNCQSHLNLPINEMAYLLAHSDSDLL